LNEPVRPEEGKINDKDILDNELWDRIMEPFDPDNENPQDNGETIQEEVEEEEAKPVVPKEIGAPSKEEVRQHMVNHIPFRSWCEHCVKGKSGGNRHSKKKRGELEDREPVVSIDYMFMSDNHGEAEERGMPIVVVKDRKMRIIRARLVPQKGVNGYAVKVVGGIIESLGHSRIVMKSDQEPAIMALKDAVRSENRIDIVMEESPEDESKSNGEV